jgi:hypothetical protein
MAELILFIPAPLKPYLKQFTFYADGFSKQE